VLEVNDMCARIMGDMCARIMGDMRSRGDKV
jgi:hypothetical protein